MKNNILFNYFKLIFGVFIIWAYFWVVHPLLIKHLPSFAHYLETAQKYNIDPSAIYYTDVPITLEAEMNNRDAVRFSDPTKK